MFRKPVLSAVGSTQRNVIDEDIALRIPAVDKDGNAGLRGSCGEGDGQLGVAAATGPGRGSALYTKVGIGAIDIGAQRVGMVGLHCDGLIALAIG